MQTSAPNQSLGSRYGLRLAILALVAVSSACASSASSSTVTGGGTSSANSAARAEIANVLAHGARAWNAGDLAEFLSDYLPDSTTSFIGRTGVLHGVEAIRGVYASRFAPGAQRDSLHFENLEVDLLTPDIANAIAYYVLVRRTAAGDSVASRGPTSLVMRRVNGRWRIVHDHSS